MTDHENRSANCVTGITACRAGHRVHDNAGDVDVIARNCTNINMREADATVFPLRRESRNQEVLPNSYRKILNRHGSILVTTDRLRDAEPPFQEIEKVLPRRHIDRAGNSLEGAVRVDQVVSRVRTTLPRSHEATFQRRASCPGWQLFRTRRTVPVYQGTAFPGELTVQYHQPRRGTVDRSCHHLHRWGQWTG